MKLILVTTNKLLEKVTDRRPIADIDVEVIRALSLAEALSKILPEPPLVVVDLDSVSLTPDDYSAVSPERLITLGQQADSRLAGVQHFQVDEAGNFWAALLLLSARVAKPVNGYADTRTAKSVAGEGVGHRGRILTPQTAYAITNSASAGLVAIDGNGRISDASDQLVITFQDHAKPLLGASIYQVMGDCQDGDLESVIRDSAAGTVVQFEFVDPRPPTPVTWLLLGHLITADGDRHLVAIVRNITPRRKAEAAITLAAEKSQAILEALPDGICVLDHEQIITACNAALARLHGYLPEELIGQHVDILADPLEPASRRQSLTSTTGYKAVLGVRRTLHRDGHLLEMEIHRIAIGVGPKRQYIAALRDLSERHAAQRQLQTSESRYETIFGAIPDGIAITTQDGLLLEVNQAYCDLVGHSREELLGLNIATLVATDLEELKHFYQSILKDHRASAHPQTTLRDGRTIIVDVFGALIPASQPNAPPQVVIAHRDLTAQTDAEQSSRQLSGKLDRLVATTPLAVFEMDLETNISSWNPAAEKLFGYSAEQALRLRLKDVTPPDRHYLVDRILASLMANPEPIFHLGQGRNRAQEVLELEWYITPINDEQGRITSIITMANNITERSQLEFQLRQSQKMEALGQLAGGIAHDFNNILTGILGYSELAADQPAIKADSKLANYVAAIHQAGSRGRDLIWQMLNYSRTQPLNLQIIDPEPVITEVLELLSATLPSTIIMERLFEPGLPRIKADPTQLHQVMMNICINARDAMPGEHGKLRVEVARCDVPRSSCHSCRLLFAGEFLRISIEDNGAGMSDEISAEIFNPFFTTKEIGKGTGMGLASADGIIHGIGGHLRVHSSPSTGTRFDIYLPLASDEPITDAAPPVGQSVASSGGGQLLLVVDDEPSVLELLVELFSSQGYRVTGCASGVEALQRVTADSDTYDLIITDHTMPGMTGVELAAELHQIVGHIPVVLCTGYMLDIDQNQPLPPNIREQLHKPVRNEELLKRVHRLLNLPTAPATRTPPTASPAG